MKSISFDAAVAYLLDRAGLPVADLAAGAPVKLYGERGNGKLVGVVGLEFFGTVALLRSLAVCPENQKSGLGRALVAYAERKAAGANVAELYLLTNTAESYFEGLGYHKVPRAEAPAAIAKTSEFSSLCPSSAAFMRKVVGSG